MVAGVTARGWSAGAPPSLRSWGPTGAGGVGIQKPPPPPPTLLSPLLSAPHSTEKAKNPSETEKAKNPSDKDKVGHHMGCGRNRPTKSLAGPIRSRRRADPS
jgi:hypothetical protein